MKEQQLRRAITDTALPVLKAHEHDPEIRLQVAALAGSLDDTLSDELVLRELKALKAGGSAFSKIFADSSSRS